MAARIVSFFQGIKFADVIDIVIISTFIYLALVWLKKARARFMFIGMIVIGLIYILARLFGLYLTTMALQAFFAVAVIMIVIIFQDDLRHFFERIAIVGVTRRSFGATSFDRNIDILMSVLADLSRKKIGALVVIRGRDPLDRHLEAGIDLDGLMSQALIESIFDPHAPTHDGAVIVEGGRIARLGCHLPLSINISEIGRLGTRHAAALGITEHTDALALVVSEEHGTILVAEDGKIRHPTEVPQLKYMLKEFYSDRFPEKKGMGLVNALVRHFPEKIVAVIIAISLWLAFAHHTEMIRRDLVVPIEYRNLASDRIIAEPKVKEVAVTLSGTEQGFGLLKAKEVKVSLDTSSMQDGENKIALTRELVRNAAGLSVINISPDEITLYSYRMLLLDVPVEFRVRGRAVRGITVRDIKVEPKTVPALFPSTFPKDKAVITTELVDLSAVEGPTTLTPKLVVGPDLRFPGDKVPEVRVIIDAEKKAAEKVQETEKAVTR